jgi:hypothetical protein
MWEGNGDGRSLFLCFKDRKGAPQYFYTFLTFFIQKNYLCARLKKIALSCQQ